MPMNWGGPKKLGDVCPRCWTPYFQFVREDMRDPEEQLRNPATQEQLTILICACEEDPDDLVYRG